MSSDDIVIDVEGLTKIYYRYDSPTDRLMQFIGKKPRYQEFRALDNVSFQVKKGSTMGIVGKNGSGKSTLLQIIAGTVAPTYGSVRVKGKVVALLELGSGFNPEFTGRENAYLNSAMFGISRELMPEKMREIEEFADIGDYIDQPVKTYSSGMFARLAFAIAINMEPDILIIDEILAVGDLAFQAKCVSKMRDLKERGVTLLFVSHSVDAIKSMCNTALLLNKGKLIDQGTAEYITNRYLALIRNEMNNEFEALQTGKAKSSETIDENTTTLNQAKETNFTKNQFVYGKGEVYFKEVELVDANFKPTKAFEFSQEAILKCKIRSNISAENVNISFLVRDITGIDLFGTTMFDENVKLLTLRESEEQVVYFKFPVLLRQGSYSISVAVNRVTQKDYSDVYLYQQIDGAVGFEVIRKLDRPVHYKMYVPTKIEIGN